MKKRHPYDRSLSDKMEQLPLPDVQKNWQEMRRLLDDDSPGGGGYRRRRGGWWLFGTVLLFVITGSWMLTTMNFSRQNADPPVSRKVNISPPQSDEVAGNVLNNSEKPKAADDKILHSTIKNSPPFKGGEGREADGVVTNPPEQDEPDRTTTQPVASLIKPRVPNPRRPSIDIRHSSSNDGEKSAVSSGKRPAASKRRAYYPVTEKRAAPDSISDLSADETTTSATPGSAEPEVAGPEAPEATNSIGLVHPAISVAADLDSLNPENMLMPDYTPVSRRYYRQNKKYGIPANIRQPYTTEGRTFAIGLSLPLGFPLGDQKMLGYNSNAGPNTASDYLPSPHIQYHFSGKSYIQTEFQFMSPQFIKPVLLYKDHYSTSSYSVTNSVTARKLYYFNIPVSVHYSPFRHFYMGTGLQFSTLLSGIAMREQQNSGMVPGGAYVYKVSYSKFSNDSLSNRMNSNEMRLMLDANYYWHKFTVGLRYNQALSNYVSMRAAPGAPYSLDKNKALQFYMRYNLWEDRKRKSLSGRTMVKK